MARTWTALPARATRRALAVVAVAGALATMTQLPLASAAFTAVTGNGGNAFGAANSFCVTPGSTTLTVLNDAEVDEKDPTKNYGNKAPIEVRSHAGDNRRIFMRPALPAVPTNCTLTSAVLTLTIVNQKQDRTYVAYRATSQWDVNTITWANQPGITGSATSAPIVAGATWSIDVTPQVLALYASGTNYGLRIQDSAESDSKDLNNSFDSLDGSSPGRVTYTWG